MKVTSTKKILSIALATMVAVGSISSVAVIGNEAQARDVVDVLKDMYSSVKTSVSKALPTVTISKVKEAVQRKLTDVSSLTNRVDVSDIKIPQEKKVAFANFVTTYNKKISDYIGDNPLRAMNVAYGLDKGASQKENQYKRYLYDKLNTNVKETRILIGPVVYEGLGDNVETIAVNKKGSSSTYKIAGVQSACLDAEVIKVVTEYITGREGYLQKDTKTGNWHAWVRADDGRLHNLGGIMIKKGMVSFNRRSSSFYNTFLMQYVGIAKKLDYSIYTKCNSTTSPTNQNTGNVTNNTTTPKKDTTTNVDSSKDTSNKDKDDTKPTDNKPVNEKPNTNPTDNKDDTKSEAPQEEPLKYDFPDAVGNETNESFSKAKKLLQEKVHMNKGKTVYCGCDWSAKVVDIQKCGYVPQSEGMRARSQRVEWEHIVPAENFGRSFASWRDGDDKCSKKNGTKYSGRACARKVDAKFRLMEADMYNLWPASGEVNGRRSNYDMGVVTSVVDDFGTCKFKIDTKQRIAEPQGETKGVVARTYFYMDSVYGRGIAGGKKSAKRKLYQAWDKQYPVTKEECRRAKVIEKLQGNKNPILEDRCVKAGIWKK